MESLTLPKKLGDSPLYESIFEIRFVPKRPDAADLLVGILFSKLNRVYTRHESLPLAGLPREFRDKNPDLRYKAKYHLIGESGTLFVGDEVAGVSLSLPYMGWDDYASRILQFLGALRDSGEILRVERYSMKALNILSPLRGQSQMSLVNLDINLAGFSLDQRGLHFRCEIVDNAFIRIVETRTETTVQGPSGSARGLMLAIDCVSREVPPGFLEDPGQSLELIHGELKKVFFAVVSEAALVAMRPEY